MYGTIADWRTWATARGDSAPTDATDGDATAALQRASDYIKYNYVVHFISGYDETSDGVEEATYIAAGLELATPNFFTTNFTPTQQKVLTAVGAIKWTPVTEKSGNSDVPMSAPRSTMIDAMLNRYVGNDIGFSIKAIGETS